MSVTTRRRTRGYAVRHPLPVALGLLLGTVALLDILHWLGWILATGAIAAGAYLTGRNRRPGTGPTAERDQLEARAADLARQVGGLRGQLERQAAEHRAECATLTEAMHAAWDAAANARPPAPRPAAGDETSPRVAAMLADPLSGVHRLTGRR